MARAVRFDRYGGRDVLYIADVATPEPEAGETVVDVRAASINPIAYGDGLGDRLQAAAPNGIDGCSSRSSSTTSCSIHTRCATS